MKKTITDVNVENKRVFVRADFNVPLDENCNITDDTRIQKTLPTIKYLLEHNAAVILSSHLGRPKGQVVEKYSLKPVAKRLSELLGVDVKFAPDCVGAETKPWPTLSNRAKFSSWKTSVSIRKKKRTVKISLVSSLPWLKSASTMLSAAATALTLPLPASLSSCPWLRASSSKKKSASSAVLSITRLILRSYHRRR